MTLEAGTPSLRQLYPNGCHVYDARGRLLRMVVACNPETGEVICWRSSRIAATLLRIIKGKNWPYGDCLFRRHGFWPAPLRVVPVPYRGGDGAREQRAAIDAIEESIRPMLKRGEWLDAWRGINR